MLSLILAAALLQADASPAAPVTVAPVTSEGAQIVYGLVEGKGQAKSKRVCFNDAMLGSKIPTKRCMDREEFERRQRDNREFTRKIQDDARAPTLR
ncbi:MAG: hypothetical protein JNK30_08740 [Phenylobacterium sp.]|uniref:hypothetical protein n=1 Tax=Phenylobacterium sp. TaxID=1871053 RepID=UPI001A45321A|nr:hypothetical protein [Phenylobacterium sp.]MBL8771454.1 hypothetical protein [Phenylobacterium sp.]